MAEESELIVGRDGTVIAATGDLPGGLVDTCLDHCSTLSSAVRDAGRALLQELAAAPNRLVSRTVPLADGERSIRLIAIEALGIRRTPTDVPRLLLAKLGVIASQAATVDVTLSIEAAPDVPARVPVDAEKLAWAVSTLVGNALRYMQTGSRRISGARIAVRTTFDAATATVVIEVEDDGPGISSDTVARLFKRDGLNVRGSGLALLLISDILAAHGGRIAVNSNTAATTHGTKVRLTLPIQ